MKLNTKDLWVWQFSADGSVTQLIDKARAAGCGVNLKVLDGVNYMATFDRHPDAIDSPKKAATIARRFEEAGVPVSFWQLPRGHADPSYEARAILETDRAWRPRAWYLDVEPYAQFWDGPYATPANALRIVRAVKGFSKANHADGLAATVVAAPDGRPWALNDSMFAFCQEADAIAPQDYWRTFEGNHNWYARYGYPVAPDQQSGRGYAQHVVTTSIRFFRHRFPTLPVLPILQGDADADELRAAIDVVRYLNEVAKAAGQPAPCPNFSVWRAGVTNINLAPTLAAYTPPGASDEGQPVDPEKEALRVTLELRKAAAALAGQLPEGESIGLMQNILDFFKAQK